MESLVLYLTRVLGVALGKRTVRAVLGPPAARQLAKVVRAALAAPELAELAPESERDRLLSALREHADHHVGPAWDSGQTVRATLRESIRQWVAPLAEPVDALDGDSYLKAHGFDPDAVAETLFAAVLAGITADALDNGPLKPLDDILRSDLIIEEIRARADSLPRARPAEIGVVDHFTGRAAELDKLAGQLTEPRSDGVPALVAVDGMPGVGKSALVRQLARRPDVRVRFPDGVVLVDLCGWTAGLKPLDPARALEELMYWAGMLAVDVPGDLQSRLLLWRRWIAGRRMLLILDNALDEAQVEQVLPADPGCAALITSRQRLNHLPGVAFQTLGAMGDDEAADLLTKLVGSSRLDDEEAVTEIMRLCAGWPLAIRLAAGHFLADDDTNCAEVAELLPGGDGDDLVRRHVQVSYERLRPDLRVAFRHLAGRAGPDVTPFAAALVTGRSEAAAIRTLRALFHAGLLQRRGPGHWRAHDLIRAFARDVSESEDRWEDVHWAEVRTLQGYLAAARIADQLMDGDGALPADLSPPVEVAVPVTGDEARAWFVAERENLGPVVASAVTEVFAMFHNLPEDPDEGEVEAILGRLAGRLGVGAADDLVVHSQELGDSAADLGELASRQLGRLGFPDAALGCVLGVGLWRPLTGDDGGDGVLDVLIPRDVVYPNVKDDMQSLVRERHEAGDRWNEGRLLSALGNMALDGHRPDEADEAFQAALAIIREIGDRRGEAGVLANLGRFAATTNDRERARELLTQALAIYDELGPSFVDPVTHEELGSSHADELRHELEGMGD